MSRKYVAAALAVLLLGGTVGGVLAVTPSPDTAEEPTQQTACNYQQVFDRTIDSVVSVQTGGGQGSGFVVAANGNVSNTDVVGDAGNTSLAANASYLITNAHVVGQSDSVTVQFNRGEYRTGDVVGQSTYADLAVVRVDETPGYVSAVDVASDDPERGQPVAALGNPFGLEQTITHGIVSGVNRSMSTELGFTVPNVVQTDAPISPGNSGGPLVTCDGTVVGVNTAGIAQSGAENIGFAISPSVIQTVVPDLVSTGEFAYPYLGVRTKAVTPPVAEANDLNETRGIMVVTTPDGSPASDVLQGSDRLENVDGTSVPVGGDVILAVDGTEIRTGEDLATYLITETEPGQTIDLTVVRDGDRETVTVTVGERPEPQSA